MANTSMNGWDVVALVSIPYVNAAIVDQGSSPKLMTVLTNTMNVQATFGDWQIDSGSVDLVTFKISIDHVSGTVDTSQGEIITQFDYSGLTASVQLRLKFVDASKTNNVTSQNLVIDSQNPPTSVISLLDGDEHPLVNNNVLDDAYIKAALTTWMDSNLSRFGQVFSSVQLDSSTGSDDQWAFCMPAVVDYTYVSGTTLASSYLGILYNTSGKTALGSVAQIDPSFVPAGCEAAFMISPQMFLNSFLAPGVVQQFGMQASALDIDTSQMSISLHSGTTVSLPAVYDKSGSSYHPKLIALQIAVQDSVVTTFAKTSTVVKKSWLGTITSYDVSQSFLTLGLDETAQSLVYTNSSPPISNHYTKESEGITITEDILGVVGIVAFAISAVLTDGASLLVLGAVLGLAQGGFQFGVAWLEENGQNDAPEIDGLATNMSLPVQWTSGGLLKVSHAGLYQGGFFLAGTLQTSST